MAVNISAGDVYEVKIFCSCNNQTGLNVVHYVAASVSGTGGTDLQFATALDGFLAPLYKPAISNISTYYGVKVQRISPLPKSLPQTSTGNQGVGSGGTAGLPLQVSGVITLTTNLAGRANRGRVYIPFPAQIQSDATLTKPTAAYVGTITAIGAELLQTITVGSGANQNTMTPVIFHRKLATITFVTGSRANQKWGTQRRRGNYGQLNPFPPV